MKKPATLHPMTKERSGRWSATLRLQPGRHECRFVLDGRWQDDPMAARFVANPFGSLNAVIEVEPLEAPAASRRP